MEKTESFMVFFPDGTMSFTNGGQDNMRNRTWFARIVMASRSLPFSRSTSVLALKEKRFDSKK